MAKANYLGVNNLARKGKKGYFGVDNLARKVKKAYIGDDNSKARLFFNAESHLLFTYPSQDIYHSIDQLTNRTKLTVQAYYNASIKYDKETEYWCACSGSNVYRFMLTDSVSTQVSVAVWGCGVRDGIIFSCNTVGVFLHDLVTGTRIQMIDVSSYITGDLEQVQGTNITKNDYSLVTKTPSGEYGVLLKASGYLWILKFKLNGTTPVDMTATRLDALPNTCQGGHLFHNGEHFVVFCWDAYTGWVFVDSTKYVLWENTYHNHYERGGMFEFKGNYYFYDGDGVMYRTPVANPQTFTRITVSDAYAKHSSDNEYIYAVTISKAVYRTTSVNGTWTKMVADSSDTSNAYNRVNYENDKGTYYTGE